MLTSSVAVRAYRGTLSRRCSEIATLVLLAATLAEREYCQRHCPELCRSPAVRERHADFFSSIKTMVTDYSSLVSSVQASLRQKSAAATVGVAVLAACVLMLETAPATGLAVMAGELATKAEMLGGLVITLMQMTLFVCYKVSLLL